ncbi:hypothetical protein CRV24_003973 [Beauveria bassiana]|uniref:Uncharacterized protein n=1 Tax=Beauveria bassiana (strain ARSEF 2860) TaxID=655819 RepID=J5JF55_BEAB2|nr:uncharacterized protein BBA_06442 [Beauveria bassiana ARSEF 2860]EJP64448.1 hypothetical protein BBA_06442 [Beauveria bassiana ARSEF 2860]KAF1735054.1 hypothetical protein CRV24_003973 [Beauveria bassiana]KAH8710577.1 hypothetical protein HC256_007415 [Beauveria bassiana]
MKSSYILSGALSVCSLVSSAPTNDPEKPAIRFSMYCYTEEARRNCRNGRSRCNDNGDVQSVMNLCRMNCSCLPVAGCGIICKQQQQQQSKGEAEEEDKQKENEAGM